MNATTTDLLDCTLRDGGYYTLWDFPRSLVETYLTSMSKLPVATVELGYCNVAKPGYAGQYYYLTPETTAWAKGLLSPHQRLAIMLDEKSVEPSQVAELLEPHRPYVDLVRIAVAPGRLRHSVELCQELHKLDLPVGLNIMYLSKYWDNVASLDSIDAAISSSETLALVDSYGSCTPQQVARAVSDLVTLYPSARIGFHGHDNLGLAVANSLAAIDGGASVIDGTVTGMGRGPGNTRTETFIVQQAHGRNEDVDYSALAGAIGAFDELLAEHRWGTNLVYMISGAAGLPQNNVMDWLGKNRYSMPAIIHALRGDAELSVEIPKVPALAPPVESIDQVIVIGGGASVADHTDAITRYADTEGATVIHATTRHLAVASKLPAGQYLAVAGDNPHAELSTAQRKQFSAVIVPTGPRFPLEALDYGDVPVREVPPFEINDPTDHLGPVSDVAPLALALGAATALGAREVVLVGFDGYSHATLAQQELVRETQDLISAFRAKHPSVEIRSATRTLYDVPTLSIYAPRAASGVSEGIN